MTDDWFAEPKPVETLHDKYTRRLVAWGYLTKRGTPAWEQSPLAFATLLQQEYNGMILDMLNQPLLPSFLGYGRGDWTRNPEGPA